MAGAALRGRAEYGMDNPNWGSARSDYGDYAYGGRLNEVGIERAAGEPLLIRSRARSMTVCARCRDIRYDGCRSSTEVVMLSVSSVRAI